MLKKDNENGEDEDDEEYDDDDEYDDYWDDEEDTADGQEQVCGKASWLEPLPDSFRASAHFKLNE